MDEVELDSEAERLRPSVRPLVVAGVANVLFAVVLLGIPYTRGPQRAREIPARFAAFASCLYAADAAADPGLGLPRGERARYASLVVAAPEGWPGECREALLAIPPDESLFLFPAIKDAEAQVRQAVALVDAELEGLAQRQRQGERTASDRPMRALARLRGALAELGVASGVGALSADRDAIELAPAPGDLPTPSIIPTRVTLEDDWAIWVEGAELLLAAMDERTLAHVRVTDRGMEQRVTRRRALVEAIVPAEPPWVVFHTSAALCGRAEDRCAGRATGLASFVEDRQTMEPMVSIGGHPAADAGQTLLVRDAHVHLVAVGDEGPEVRRFALPALRARALGEELEVPRVRADARWPLPAEATAPFAWIDAEPPALAFATSDGAGFVQLDEPGGPPSLFDVPAGTRRIATCGTADPWVAVGSERDVVVRRPDGAAEAIGVALRPPTRGSIALICREDGADLWTLGDGRIERRRCDLGGCGEADVVVAGGADRFDVVAFGADQLMAWTRAAADGLVELTRVRGGEWVSSVPAPCWSDPIEGLCGEPRLATDGRVVFLAARQDSDLRVIRSEDGVRWTALPGLEQP